MYDKYLYIFFVYISCILHHILRPCIRALLLFELAKLNTRFTRIINLHQTFLVRCTKMYRLRGDLNSVVCWRVTSPEEFSIDEQLYVGISCILSQLFHLKKYQEIKKSKNPSYLALAYLPLRQFMNYTTSRTLRLYNLSTARYGVN